MVAMHGAVDHRDLAVHLHADSGRHRVEGVEDLRVGARAGPPFGHRRSRQGRKTLAIGRVVPRSRLEEDAEGDERRCRRRQDDRPHEALRGAWTSVTTVRFSGRSAAAACRTSPPLTRWSVAWVTSIDSVYPVNWR